MTGRCDRWRRLYRAAVRQRELHHKIIGDHARPEVERNHSRRLRAQAEGQIRLLTEAEGGAGVLRQIAEDPAVLPLLARRAREVCHFNPDILEDKGAQTCGKACYECLLEYSNQPDHKDLNCHLMRDLLHELSRSVCRPAGGTGLRAERMNALRKRYDSKLEIRWLDLVDKLMLLPPSDAQYLIEACSTSERACQTPGHRQAMA